MPRSRQTILPFGTASFRLALMPSETTRGFASTATKTTIPPSIAGILSLLRVAASTLNLANLATMTHTDVDKHAWSATAETINLIARTTRKSSPSFRSIARVTPGSGPGKLSQRYHIHAGSRWWYPALAHLFCPRSSCSNALGTAHNPGGNTLARQPGTSRNGNRQLDGGTAPSTTLSGGTSFGFRRCSCSVASLSNNAAQIAFVGSLRAPTPSADDSHGVVPAVGTSASSVVLSSQVIFVFSVTRMRVSSDIPSVMV